MVLDFAKQHQPLESAFKRLTQEVQDCENSIREMEEKIKGGDRSPQLSQNLAVQRETLARLSRELDGNDDKLYRLHAEIAKAAKTLLKDNPEVAYKLLGMSRLFSERSLVLHGDVAGYEISVKSLKKQITEEGKTPRKQAH